MKTAIIGGGAAGLVASIVAARNKDEVCVFEKNSDTGKKLLLTGSGRCNYGNIEHDLKHYHSNDQTNINKIINEENIKKVDNFFDSIGVVAKNKNGYLYPFSEKSTSIKSALMAEAKANEVKFVYDTTIEKIIAKENGYLVNGEYFDKVILCTGSKCAPKTGSDGLGYQLASVFGHNIIEINPSLVQLITNTGLETNWAGKRCEVDVSHYENDCFKKKETGEIQFTNYGLSGICIFNLSRNIRLGLNKKQKEEVHINFLPWLKDDINKYLNNRASTLGKRNITELCDGFLDYSIVYIIIKYLNINANKTWFELSCDEQNKLGKALVDFVVPIIDTKSFLESQTCSGGIDLTEIDLNTMESLKQENLYFAGEIIDIDGDCGGYNLTIAWITGILAGEHHD